MLSQKHFLSDWRSRNWDAFLLRSLGLLERFSKLSGEICFWGNKRFCWPHPLISSLAIRQYYLPYLFSWKFWKLVHFKMAEWWHKKRPRACRKKPDQPLFCPKLGLVPNQTNIFLNDTSAHSSCPGTDAWMLVPGLISFSEFNIWIEVDNLITIMFYFVK